MSTTLTLIDAGWQSVRTTAERGLRIDALNRLTRLLARPDVPAALAGEGHRLAGELALDCERYATARRHLKTAAQLEPENAKTHYLTGLAWEDDPDGCDRRAARCFKKAVKLDANPLYRAAFGRAAARCGVRKCGVREMLAAAELAADNVEVVRIAAGGLLEAGRVAEAQRVIAKARFLLPGNTELAALWELAKFESARQGQRKLAKVGKTHENARYAQDAHFATDGDRVTLPFVRLADAPDAPNSAKRAAGGTLRHDAASFPRPHLARLGVRRADG
jgi:tetratricopeptide (TPR) repeat protein